MKKHILVVDDELSIREVIQNLLEFKGYAITTAEDGADALQKTETHTFDLILTDISMPNMNGYELIKAIKKTQPLAVIIVLTGYSSIEGAVKAIHMGAFQYLAKPIKTSELYEVVERGLKQSEDLYGPLQKTFVPGEDSIQNGESIIFHGFSSEEKAEILELATTRKYKTGEDIITIDPNLSTIFVVNEGEISIWLNNTIVDYIKKWDSWGEDSFVLAGTVPVKLRAETAVTLLSFDRKRLIDFFAYKGEKLLKRFIVNLTSSTFYKWRKSLQRIVMLKLMGTSQDN